MSSVSRRTRGAGGHGVNGPADWTGEQLSSTWVEDHLGLAGLHINFDAVVCREGGHPPKPAPDAYLAALEQLGVPAGAAMAFGTLRSVSPRRERPASMHHRPQIGFLNARLTTPISSSLLAGVVLEELRPQPFPA